MKTQGTIKRMTSSTYMTSDTDSAREIRLQKNKEERLNICTAVSFLSFFHSRFFLKREVIYFLPFFHSCLFLLLLQQSLFFLSITFCFLSNLLMDQTILVCFTTKNDWNSANCSFVGLALVYVVAGVIVQKTVRKATGREVIPNHDLWFSLPGLIKVTRHLTLCIKHRKINVINCLVSFLYAISWIKTIFRNLCILCTKHYRK